MNISTVIICRNGASRLAETILSAKDISDEIILYDSGSTDDSIEIAELFGVTIKTGTWEGYGSNRYKATQLAKHDWILMLDTDEVLDDELRESIRDIDLNNHSIVYNFRYRNFFNGKHLSHGEWGNDSHIRMANRRSVKLDEEVVHEKLFLQPHLRICTLQGHVLHYTANNTIDYTRKMTEYASLSAEKYLRQGRRSTYAKLYLSPWFSFMQNYFFKLGFLNGWQGFVCAGMTSWYTFLKYAKLKELYGQEKKQVKEATTDIDPTHLKRNTQPAVTG